MKLPWSGMAVLAFSISLGGADPSNDAWERQLHLGETLAGQGRLGEAREILEGALRKAESFSEIHLARTLNLLGAVDFRLCDVQAAVYCFRRASAIWEAHGDEADALAALTNLANAYLGLRQYSAAETVLNNARPRAEKTFGPDDPRAVALEMCLVNYDFSRNDYSAAAALSEQIVATARRNAADPVLATALDNLGLIYRAQNRTEASSRMFAEALAVLERGGQPSHPAWIATLEGAGTAALDARRYPEADSLLRRALTRAEETFGPNHPQTARLLRELAAVLRKTRRKPEARSLEDRAAAIERQSAVDNALGYTVDLRSSTQLWAEPISASPRPDGSTAISSETFSVRPRQAQRR